MSKIEIGIIGGSALYTMPALENPTKHYPDTPYGKPSDALIAGTIGDVPVVFLARHGIKHQWLPSEVPYRANIFALKQLGVKYLLSFSAVGALQENIAPCDFVIPDQYIDMTRKRENTFFGHGVVAHVSMATPVCPNLSELLATAVSKWSDINVHRKGTYICIEGPQFSSKAESHWYRSIGASVIGMTNMPEAKLAQEAQMAYASLAMVTDYDCWHPHKAKVTAEMAIHYLMKNAARAQDIAKIIPSLIANKPPYSEAHTALKQALVTPFENIPRDFQETIKVLRS